MNLDLQGAPAPATNKGRNRSKKRTGIGNQAKQKSHQTWARTSPESMAEPNTDRKRSRHQEERQPKWTEATGNKSTASIFDASAPSRWKSLYQRFQQKAATAVAVTPDARLNRQQEH